MGLPFAIDELYATGWSTLDSAGCEHAPDGRFVPTVERITREFADHGLTLAIRRVELFDCSRAEWSDAAGVPKGGVVGQSEHEAAVYALAQLRRSMAQSGS
ncbi:MAG: hypothetical protein AAGD00_05335 [Planctomycetota bacterium]